MKTASPDYDKIGNVYNFIGNIHGDKVDQDEALEYYQTAIDFFKKANAKDSLSIDHSYNNIAITLKQQKKNKEALK